MCAIAAPQDDAGLRPDDGGELCERELKLSLYLCVRAFACPLSAFPPVSVCLFLPVSADPSTCQRPLKTGPAAPLSLPFLSFFALLAAETRSLPDVESQEKFVLTLRLQYILPLSHTRTHTHTLWQNSYTRAGNQMF